MFVAVDDSFLIFLDDNPVGKFKYIDWLLSFMLHAFYPTCILELHLFRTPGLLIIELTVQFRELPFVLIDSRLEELVAEIRERNTVD